uniref:Uncharacterized protein n=1 Tax=Magallana gigas TaxID=29159 RepID=K1PSZ9_MAGGI
MWLKMGDELEMEGLPKGPLSPTPESHGNCETFSPVASYSPALDSNCSAFAPVTCTISQAEDSILTTSRRTYPDKMLKLEKRMKEQSKQDVLLEQVNVLKTLLARVTVDCEQMKIIINFLEDKVDNSTSAKRVKFTTL